MTPIHEPNETFDVNLTNPSNASIADNKGVGTITNYDPDVTPPNTFITSGPSGDTDSTSAALTFASNRVRIDVRVRQDHRQRLSHQLLQLLLAEHVHRARPGHSQVRRQGD